VARKWVEDAETTINQEQEDMRQAETTGLTTRKLEIMFPQMFNDIRASLSNRASSDDQEDVVEEDDQDTEVGELSTDYVPSWVMGTISKVVQQHMERFWQKQMKLDKLKQPGWGDAADYICVRDKKYGMTELRFPVVVKPHTDHVATAPALTSFGELTECLHSVSRILELPQGTSRPGSSHIKLGSIKPESNKGIAGLLPNTEADSSHIQTAKPVQPVSNDPCMLPPQLIGI